MSKECPPLERTKGRMTLLKSSRTGMSLGKGRRSKMSFAGHLGVPGLVESPSTTHIVETRADQTLFILFGLLLSICVV